MKHADMMNVKQEILSHNEIGRNKLVTMNKMIIINLIKTGKNIGLNKVIFNAYFTIR